jgi:hypothetical protein
MTSAHLAKDSRPDTLSLSRSPGTALMEQLIRSMRSLAATRRPRSIWFVVKTMARPISST